jgi:hypothetical protein
MRDVAVLVLAVAAGSRVMCYEKEMSLGLRVQLARRRPKPVLFPERDVGDLEIL